MPEVPKPDDIEPSPALTTTCWSRCRPGPAVAVADGAVRVPPRLPRDELNPPKRLLTSRSVPPVRRVGDAPELHLALLAYALDFHLLGTAPSRTVITITSRRADASLDHGLWFHRDFRADDWLLYNIDSPSAQGSRGLVAGPDSPGRSAGRHTAQKA